MLLRIKNVFKLTFDASENYYRVKYSPYLIDTVYKKIRHFVFFLRISGGITSRVVFVVKPYLLFK